MYSIIFILFLCHSGFSLVYGTQIVTGQPFKAPDDWNRDRNNDRWKNYFTTRDPFYWERWDWKWPTARPHNFDYLSNNDNSGAYIAVAVIIFVLLVILFAYLKYIFDEQNSRNSTYATLSSINNRQRGTSRHSAIPRTATIENPQTVVDFSNPMSDVSNRSSVVDQPPPYADVVLGDLIGTNKFPGVNPSIPDTPPPQYSENNVERY